MTAPITVAAAHTKDPARLHVGTLRYTMAGLLWVFVWLLWGDFCFTVMEYVNSQIVPLRLRELQAPDWVLPIILTTVPSIISFTLNPVISTISDRHRGPRGRRIPFLLFSTPFISATLVLMAFSPEISALLHRWVGPLGGWGVVGISIFTVGMLMASFKVFDTFVNTTFWYLFNDVVPQAFMARFMGMFRVVASLAAMLFSYFFYEHALTHMRWIYLGAASIYFVGFTMMCLFVKEGEYPPPPTRPGASLSIWRRVLAAMQEYVRQCLSHRLYIYYFLMGMFMVVANAIALFGVFLNLSLGITLKQLAMINTGIQFVMLMLNYPAGALADRFHPIRIMLCMMGCLLLVVPLNFVWMFGSFPADRFFHVSILGYALDLPANLSILISLMALDLPITLLLGAVGMPLMMRLLPREEFGQFCSFNALVSAVMNIVASLSVAWFMTGMRTLLPDAVWGKDFCYRMIPAWRLPFLALATLFLCLLFREWKRHGGEKNYTPPVPPQG
ncbi:MAG: hypothetical protein WCH98_10720 [Verrucomicrobiota bacterium]